ncbi:ACT domain-containing protein [Candidatus Sumerlaeota bacterium]|nr:ACT domain-containing protein [Candidatus Sumerlaeota bacterium]
MAIKKQFTVCLENKPGQLARLCQALARAKVNILAISVVDRTDSGDVRLVAEKPAATRRALARARLCALVRDVVAVTLPDHPGALAEAAAILAREGINIEYAYGSTHAPCAEATCIFAVDDTAKADAVLGS